MSKRDIEKLMEVYVCNPNVYEYAYSNCQEYKTFIDNLSEDALSKIKRAHAAWKIAMVLINLEKAFFTLQHSDYPLALRSCLIETKRVSRK